MVEAPIGDTEAPDKVGDRQDMFLVGLGGKDD